MPGYMEQLLEQLGWHQGTRMPLASEDNKKLETVLIARQQEIQRLKEAIIQQQQKQADLDVYNKNVTTESQENGKLLLAQKQQVESESAACGESRRLCEQVQREAARAGRESAAIAERVQRLQNDIARLLKRADGLKSEVCGEQGALQEWRAALERSAADIGAIEIFNKQDVTKAKQLEVKTTRLKGERDRLHERLLQVCSDLAADERAAETLSGQVEEARQERGRVMATWAAAVENLRQRDKDIRHTKEDYEVLEGEAQQVTEQCREQQQLVAQLAVDNAEAERDAATLAQRLSRVRRDQAERHEQNAALHGQVVTLQRVLSDMRRTLQELRAQSRHLHDETRRLRDTNTALALKLKEFRDKKAEAQDKTRSAADRAKQLENMLAEEEKYAQSLTLNQQRAMHCSFTQRQKLLALQQRAKLARIAVRGVRSAMLQLDNKQVEVERLLMAQKETLYIVCYQVETVGSRVSHMEGAQVERECNSELVQREKRLQQVCALHAGRAALLSAHADKLRDEMRRLTRELANQAQVLETLHTGVRSRTVGAEGRRAALRDARDELCRARVDESLMKLRVAHASRAVANLDNTAFSLHAQRLQMDAAMNERRVEVEARLDMFSVQKRSLYEDCGRLRSDIREREQRIEQLMKRYDIFIASLGKDESGQQLSVTFFKIKFASERAELRARGAELDADIARCEGEVAALEASLQVMRAAHTHFVHHVSPLSQDEEEMQRLAGLGDEYYSLQGALVKLRARLAELEEVVAQLRAQHTILLDKQHELRAKQAEAESALEASAERLSRQESRLDNALDIVRAHRRRVRKLLPDTHQWNVFIMELECRDLVEAAYTAIRALGDAAALAPDVATRCAELGAQQQLQDKLPRNNRRCHTLLQRLLAMRPLDEVGMGDSSRTSLRTERGAGSSRSSSLRRAPPSRTRLSSFRATLAREIGEEQLLDGDQLMSAYHKPSLSVVTLGMEMEPVQDVLMRKPNTKSYSKA